MGGTLVEDYLHPGWYQLWCGCCGGLEWGGLEPRECGLCRGTGNYFVHRKTGTVADYPGGPLNGKMYESEMKVKIDAKLRHEPVLQP